MPFEQIGNLRYFYFSSLRSVGFKHAVLTRHGGVSQSPWESLNLGGSVGDNPEHVLANKQRILKKLNFGSDSVFDVWQVHGNKVALADAPRLNGKSQQQADIVLTDKPGITLLMRFADCVPILLYEPERHVAGIVHAGWKGTVNRAVSKAVQVMIQKYGCLPDRIIGAIGPSIGPDHYEIGSDVVHEVQRTFGKESDQILITNHLKTSFNLWKANHMLLEKEGVTHIEEANICTACNVKDFFSHRAENGRTGRFGVVAGL